MTDLPKTAVCGPSGAGKSTLISMLRKVRPELVPKVPRRLHIHLDGYALLGLYSHSASRLRSRHIQEFPDDFGFSGEVFIYTSHTSHLVAIVL